MVKCFQELPKSVSTYYAQINFNTVQKAMALYKFIPQITASFELFHGKYTVPMYVYSISDHFTL